MNDAKRDVNIILFFVFLVRRSTQNIVSSFILFSHSSHADWKISLKANPVTQLLWALTFMFLSVSSLCASLSSLSLASRLCCRDSTFLSSSCLCSLMATSSWPSWTQQDVEKEENDESWQQNMVRIKWTVHQLWLCASGMYQLCSLLELPLSFPQGVVHV